MLDADKQPISVQEDNPLANNPQINQERVWVLSIMARADEVASVKDTSSMVQNMLDLMIDVTRADFGKFLPTG